MPADWAELQILCRNCLGSGTVVPAHDLQQPPPPTIPCPSCDGEGHVEWGRIHIKAIMDAIDELTP